MASYTVTTNIIKLKAARLKNTQTQEQTQKRTDGKKGAF